MPTLKDDEVTVATLPGSRRRHLRIFRAEDGTPVQEHMPVLGMDADIMAGVQKLMAANPTGDPNLGSKTVLLFRAPGKSLAYVWFKSGYILPAHSHDTDCLYYVMAGELHLGSQVLRKGDGMFIPADAGYTYQAGPQGVEVLEFRNTQDFNFIFKRNSEAHWDRIADVLRNNSEQWKDELPPSER